MTITLLTASRHHAEGLALWINSRVETRKSDEVATTRGRRLVLRDVVGQQAALDFLGNWISYYGPQEEGKARV